MPFSNSHLFFLYSQLFLTPAPLPRILSLAGKTGIITGSNTGLGYHASAQLLARGLSRLILAVRDVKKGEAAKEMLLAGLDDGIMGRKGKAVVEVWELDLARYESVVGFVEKVKTTRGLRVDFAVLNAAVAKFGFEVNETTRHEVTTQTNWLSTALLAVLLVPVLQAQYSSSERSTLTLPVMSIVGSETAQWASLKEGKRAMRAGKSVIGALDEKRNFDPADRYYASKLLLLFFFMEFSERLDTPGMEGSSNDVVVNIVNPGFCYGSELHREVKGVLGGILATVKRIIGRSTETGARTLAHAAVVDSVESHGKYLSDEKIRAFADYPSTPEGKAMQKQLWYEMAKELRGIVDVEKVMKGKK